MTTAQNDPPILLVEDNLDDVELTMRAFSKARLANPIIVASDGVEALQHLLPENGAAPLQPALVLLDLNLPRVAGLDVLRRMRADSRTRITPVVVLTTSSHQRDIVDSYALGCNSYLTKPVDFGEFIEAAATLGLYWLALNRLPV